MPSVSIRISEKLQFFSKNCSLKKIDVHAKIRNVKLKHTQCTSYQHGYRKNINYILLILTNDLLIGHFSSNGHNVAI